MSEPTRGPSREELAVCAHDLRSTLTVIAGWNSLLSRELDPARRAEAVAGIEAAIARADALIGDALAGRLRTHTAHEPVDLAEVAARAVADAQVALGLDVSLVVDAPAMIEGDAVGMARILENLLGNAAKYAADGPVGVRVGVRDELAVLEVADRGPGIPEQMRTAMLEPFARLERDVERPGTGLGLTVVRSIAERHLGSVEILPRESGGTVVRVELPLA